MGEASPNTNQPFSMHFRCTATALKNCKTPQDNDLKKSSLECGQFLAGGISPNVFYGIIPWIQKSFFDDDVSTFKFQVHWLVLLLWKKFQLLVLKVFSHTIFTSQSVAKETWWSSFLFLYNFKNEKLFLSLLHPVCVLENSIVTKGMKLLLGMMMYFRNSWGQQPKNDFYFSTFMHPT